MIYNDIYIGSSDITLEIFVFGEELLKMNSQLYFEDFPEFVDSQHETVCCNENTVTDAPSSQTQNFKEGKELSNELYFANTNFMPQIHLLLKRMSNFSKISSSESNHSNSGSENPFLSCSENSPFTFKEVLLIAIPGGILCAFIFLVNLIIFIIFVTDQTVRKVPGHVMIVGLMVLSDVLIGIVPLPGYLMMTICGGWPLPKFACDIWQVRIIFIYDS